MKSRYLILWYLATSSVFAQGRWLKLDPPTASDLSKVCFIDSVRGWVAGSNGTILKTIDGGGNWETQITSIDDPIMDLFILDRSFGWAVAHEYPQDTLRYGTVLLRTTNGGEQWTSESYGTRHLFDGSFVGTDTGMAVGAEGTILRTVSGGLIWTLQTSGTTAWLHGVSMVDATTGTVVGTGGVILRTTNGGTTWLPQPSGTTADLFDVSFIHPDTAFVVGSGGTILRTTNRGVVWTFQTSGTTARLEGISFANSRIGTIVGSNGTVLRTTNGGVLWTSQTSGVTSLLRSVSFVNADTGLMVGAGGTILRTTNGGAQWTSQVSGTSVDLHAVCFADRDSATAVGEDGIILHTTNSGATWSTQWTGVVNTLYGASFPDAGTGTVVGQNGMILRTGNGGTYWNAQEYPITFFNAIFFFDSLNGLMGGTRGKIVRTTDGGTSWFPALVDSSLHTGFPVLHFDFYSRAYGFALGGRMDLAGVVWKTTDGGARWNATAPAGEPLYALHFIDSLNLIVIGGDIDYGSGMIQSKNAGATWAYTYLNIWGEARALAFRTPSEGYAPLGFPGTYMVTMDTGKTWHDYYTPDSSAVYDVAFPDSTHGYMVGVGGSIFKYDTTMTGVSNHSSELPTVPTLHQNYPNPFNPSTLIRYELPTASYIVLKIYDATGKEVMTLARGNRDKGLHSVGFEGNGMASGAYYYQLTVRSSTSTMTEVKKMILLK